MVTKDEIRVISKILGSKNQQIIRKLEYNEQLSNSDVDIIKNQYDRNRSRTFDNLSFHDFLLFSMKELNHFSNVIFEYNSFEKLNTNIRNDSIIKRKVYIECLELNIDVGRESCIFFNSDLLTFYLKVEGDKKYSKIEFSDNDQENIELALYINEDASKVEELSLKKISMSNFFEHFSYTIKNHEVTLFNKRDKTIFLLLRILYRKATTKLYLKEVSEYLSTNVVHMSFPHNESSECVQRFLKTEKLSSIPRSRNIAIIGAGASFSVLPGVFHLGNKSIDIIEEKIGIKELLSNKKVLEKYNEIAKHYKLNKGIRSLSFEERLFLLLHFFTEDEVRKIVHSLFELRTVPVYFYEYLAHLFKNRFFDAVINFNFDELLDQALQEEIGPGQFSTIISDGDCKDYESYIDDFRLKVPLYIKPHGTASNKGSMRFTKEQYLEIPQSVENLIEELFMGHKKDLPKYNMRPHIEFSDLNMYVFGFEMTSIEFLEIIHRVAKEKAKSKDFIINVYFFEYDIKAENEKDYVVLKKYLERYDHILRINDSFKNINVKIISLHELQLMRDKENDVGFREYLKCPLAFTIWKIQQEIKNQFKDIYPLKKLNRHNLLIDVFSEKYLFKEDRQNIIKYFSSSEYYEKRLCFELIIVCLKNKGYIQVKESLNFNNRIGMYYESYKGSFPKEDSLSRPKSIYDFLEILKLESFNVSFSDDLYRLKENLHSIINENNLKDVACCTKLIDNWKQEIDINERLIIEIFESLKIYIYELTAILYSDSVNIYPDFISSTNNIYHSITAANIITTNFSLMVNFRNMFFETEIEWTHLFMVGERGKNLVDTLETIDNSKDLRKKLDSFLKDKKIIIILSMDVELTNLKKLCDKFKIKLYISFLPYYAHNRHMQVFADIQFEDNQNIIKIDFLKSIFFYKKGFSNNINGYLLNKPKDQKFGTQNLKSIENFKKNIKILMKTFCGMYLKSFSHEKYKNSKAISIPYIRDEQYIKDFKIEDHDRKHDDGINELAHNLEMEKLIVSIYKYFV
ncbi:MAG: SIR2 family protein [Saprospiraceae bacterium]|nr:SIR2 family protein [Saprospiraceae bacterium]